MGEIWLARELKLERMVAFKVVRADLTQDPNRVTRFRQEARAASALNHPNVCTIHALGETLRRPAVHRDGARRRCNVAAATGGWTLPLAKPSTSQCRSRPH